MAKSKRKKNGEPEDIEEGCHGTIRWFLSDGVIYAELDAWKDMIVATRSQVKKILIDLNGQTRTTVTMTNSGSCHLGLGGLNLHTEVFAGQDSRNVSHAPYPQGETPPLIMIVESGWLNEGCGIIYRTADESEARITCSSGALRTSGHTYSIQLMSEVEVRPTAPQYENGNKSHRIWTTEQKLYEHVAVLTLVLFQIGRKDIRTSCVTV